jgi:hypothetical protein
MQQFAPPKKITGMFFFTGKDFFLPDLFFHRFYFCHRIFFFAPRNFVGGPNLHSSLAESYPRFQSGQPWIPDQPGSPEYHPALSELRRQGQAGYRLANPDFQTSLARVSTKGWSTQGPG